MNWRLRIKEHLIPFSTESVIAIREGRKTQTRRVIRPQPELDASGNYYNFYTKNGGRIRETFYGINDCDRLVKYAPYQVGDRLGVKESIYLPPSVTGETSKKGADTWLSHFYRYRADLDTVEIDQLKELGWKLRTARFMNKMYVQYWLEVLKVRAEKLQDIPLEDILAEGIKPLEYCPVCNGTGIPHTDFVAVPICKCIALLFTGLWDSINSKPYPWSSNPWVWVYEFGRI